jgi:hypothetical protein
MAGQAHEGFLWIFGGLRQINRDTEYFLEDVWCSPDGIDWVQATKKAPWARRTDALAVSFSGKVWLLGGCDDSGRLADVWTFEIPEGGRDWLRQ